MMKKEKIFAVINQTLLGKISSTCVDKNREKQSINPPTINLGRRARIQFSKLNNLLKTFRLIPCSLFSQWGWELKLDYYAVSKVILKITF